MVKLIDCNQPNNVVCQIGDSLFLFERQTDDGIPADMYTQNASREHMIRAILDAIEELDKTEQDFYAAILEKGSVL